MECSAAIDAGTTICLIQPFDWRIYIAPALVLISVFVAWRALGNARRIAREKATIDLIEKTESTEHYRAVTKTFTRLRRGHGFAHLGNPQTARDKADRLALIQYLNHYELIALGIHEGILEAEFYKKWMRGAFVRDWNAASGWIQGQRWKINADGRWTYYPDAYANFGKLAARWSPDAVIINAKTGGIPESEPVGAPGNEPLPATPDAPDEA